MAKDDSASIQAEVMKKPGAAPKAGGQERRAHARKKVLWMAKAFLHFDGTAYDCQVWDISDKGAKVRFPEVTPVPNRFKLWICDGGLFVCEPRRVDSNWVGVEFVDALPLSEALKIDRNTAGQSIIGLNDAGQGDAVRSDARAQSNLGAMYASGKGVPQDLVQAHKWFNLAAAGGDKEATQSRDNAASKMTPEEIAQAERLAQEWKLGDAGLAFMRGDHATALELARPLADQGGAYAQSLLGSMYLAGKGVPQSDSDAYFWASLAANSGDPHLIKIRDRIGQRLSATEIAEAQKRVREWQPAT
jgi:hypothetical protein